MVKKKIRINSMKKACLLSTLSITNPTWTEPGANRGLLIEKPATNCISHGTAYFQHHAASVFLEPDGTLSYSRNCSSFMETGRLSP
jgi:hypothetical protein